MTFEQRPKWKEGDDHGPPGLPREVCPGQGNSKYKGPGVRQACRLPGIVGKLELSVGRAVQGEFRVMGRGQALLSLMKDGKESECYY